MTTDGVCTNYQNLAKTCLKSEGPQLTEPDFWFRSLFAHTSQNGVEDCPIYSVPI